MKKNPGRKERRRSAHSEKLIIGRKKSKHNEILQKKFGKYYNLAMAGKMDKLKSEKHRSFLGKLMDKGKVGVLS